MDQTAATYKCPICEGAGVMPVLPIPRDPQAFEDKRCWACGDGDGQVPDVQALWLIEDCITTPERYTAEEAARVAQLATTVIFGVRDTEPPF